LIAKLEMRRKDMFDYILFDLDGTLTNSKEGITKSVQYALKAFGINEPDLDKLEPFIGPPLMDSFKDFYGFNDEAAKKAVEKYRERFTDIGIFENEVYPGIKEMLAELKNKGKKLAVASSKSELRNHLF
jgi:phosphoglycolate phosphatase